MSELRDFFLFCSGSNESVLKKTPTEINKHVGIGATIFFTGIFAFLAGSYAVYTVFESYTAAILIGLVWGAMIFNLDRYIVSTLKMRKSAFRNFTGALPRLVLALIIAIVIAKPLELKIFDSEIRSELVTMQQERYMEQEELLRTRFDQDQTRLKTELDGLNQAIGQQELKRDQLDQLALAEADGTGGSLLRNMGPIYRAKKQDALKAQAELDEMQMALSPQIEQRQLELDAVNEKMNQELADLNRVELTGFAARLEALDRLSQKSNAIYIANIFIMLLFIAIETTPIFVKLISSRSPYDYVLDKHEHAFAMNHMLNTSELSEATNNELTYMRRMGKYKTQMIIETEKRIIKEAVEESYEQLKRDRGVWKEIFGERGVVR